jgi:hypothetical protein
MRLTIVVLATPGPIFESPLNHKAVTDILWANSSPEDELIHISAAINPGRVEIGCFHQLPSTIDAVDATLRLLNRAGAASPQLRGWRMDRLLISDVPGAPGQELYPAESLAA